MPKFKNRKIQNLSNYTSIINFTQAFSFAWENGEAETFGSLVNTLDDSDWQYFEESIQLWESESLSCIAEWLIQEPIFHKLNDLHTMKIYCLAFINCEDVHSYDLSHNLAITLGLTADLNIAFLEKITQRLKDLIVYYIPTSERLNELNIRHTLEFIKEKIELTRNAKIK